MAQFLNPMTGKGEAPAGGNADELYDLSGKPKFQLGTKQVVIVLVILAAIWGMSSFDSEVQEQVVKKKGHQGPSRMTTRIDLNDEASDADESSWLRRWFCRNPKRPKWCED